MITFPADEGSTTTDTAKDDSDIAEVSEPHTYKPDISEVSARAGQRPSRRFGRLRRIAHAYWAKKFVSLPLTVLLLVGVLLAVPATRYPLLGLFLEKDFVVIVLDETSNKPVTKAQVRLGDVVAQTDNNGRTKLRVAVGSRALAVSKKYYKTSAFSVLVPLKQKQAPFKVYVTATGRQVPVTVTNKISGKPLAGALLAAAGTEVKTDKEGKAVIVLPADKPTAVVKISLGGFNTATSTVQVTEQQVPQNAFQLVASGKVYFLSKLSGKIDVVKTNLDGTERQTVLAGTGKESGTDTILLASRDWKYLAFKSQRDGGDNAKLFLINTATDKLTTMDEGNAYFEVVGWAEHRFVYKVGRSGVLSWQPKGQALKSFDATTEKIAIIEETDGEGTGNNDYAFSQFGSVYLLNNDIVYSKSWNSYYYGNRLNGKTVSLVSVAADGSGRKTIKDFPIPDGRSFYGVELRLYGALELYAQVPGQNGEKPSYFDLEDGKLTTKSDVTETQFYDPYPTFLASPNGKQTLWAEARDGKNTLFVGDSTGHAGKQVANLSEYSSYGWYTDDYFLVSKGGSELAIMPVAGGAPLKISDYHKPDFNFRGYGGGYGGL